MKYRVSNNMYSVALSWMLGLCMVLATVTSTIAVSNDWVRPDSDYCRGGVCNGSLTVTGNFSVTGDFVNITQVHLNATNITADYIRTNFLFGLTSVGIGTTAPSDKLNVVGNVNITKNLTVNDDVFIDGNVTIGTRNTYSGALNLNAGYGKLSTGLTWGDGDTGIFENSDDNLYFYQNNKWAMLFGSVNVQFNRGFIPGTHNTYTFGAINRYWLGGYITSMFSQNISVADNIGIGTNNSIHALTVVGDVNITENLIVGGNFTGNQIYGEAWFHTHTAVPLTFATQDIYYNLTFNESKTNGFMFDDAEDSLEPEYAGLYMANYMASGDGQNNHVYHTTVLVNGVAQLNMESHKKLTAGSDILTMTGNGFLRLSAGDMVQLGTMDSGATGDGNYYSSNLNLVRVGD